ncbi:NTP transferase domain-containing protein [Bacillus aerolatus]|uniref:Probable molybdenum cofactor guanylyltransferase n=1 Tax=Bacillus aerolatus TaxID=2653354 RepID=A0A6I1FKN9_9BACI|nr:molybdenum cofactor guanylyltransferase [Bacillus aerolatus]KAB7709190.1 NTP transferase domain-containing protein [Bacillus aerolatus]
MGTIKRKERIGIVLAGGESRRFGEPKAFALYNGSFFYERAVQALAPYTDQTVLTGHPALAARFNRQPSVQVIEDLTLYSGKGPLAGLYSVMKQFDAKWYIVLPCDMPLVNTEVIGRLTAASDEAFDAIVPYIAGKWQPLAAVYHRRVLPVVINQLTAGHYRMVDFLKKINTKIVTEVDLQSAEEIFKNINTKDAYRQLIADKT